MREMKNARFFVDFPLPKSWVQHQIVVRLVIFYTWNIQT